MARDLTKRYGYGQVEPNHLSGIVTGQIYAQLPAASTITQLEQGQFAKYDYANGVVNFTGDGEFMLVYNEEKNYDERKQSHKDFALKVGDFTDGKLYPRLIKTNVGDIYTTNTFSAATSDTQEITMPELTAGNYLTVGANGFLTKTAAGANGALPDSDMVWKVVKVYTMPDMTPGVKIQRVK